TLSGGNILDDGLRRTLRVQGEFVTLGQMADIVVKHDKGNIVYLRDIAEIRFDFREKESYARLMQLPVVSVDVIKRGGENMLRATEKIQVALDKVRPNFPADLQMTITNDQSEFVQNMVSSLENNIISGVILVVLVLLFFLGTRNALFVGVAIPLSMFISFIVLGAFGITINMMILFSLIMALGMLVDNGIVVVENVYRLMELGYSPLAATRKGVGEVALPIISSTATTLAAFLPLAIWPGMMGQFMSYLPIGLIITLSSSLFVALVINPVLIASFMKLQDGELKPDFKKVWRNVGIVTGLGASFLLLGAFQPVRAFSVMGNIGIVLGMLILLNVYVLSPMAGWFQEHVLPWMEHIYSRTLTYALRGKRPYVFFGGTILLFIASFGLMKLFPPKVIFFPINEPKYVNVFIELPLGTDIEVTNEFAKKIESEVAQIIRPHLWMVESMITKVGEDTADPNDRSAVGQGSSPNKARITINFSEYKKRKNPETGTYYSTGAIMEELRSSIRPYPGVIMTVNKDAAGPPAGKPINIEIAGSDYSRLNKIAADIIHLINESDIEGIEHLKSDFEDGKPELIIDIDRDNARRFGLSTQMVAGEIRTSLFGREISQFKMGEDDYPIQLRLNDQFRYNLDAIMNKSITFRDQSSGKIHQVPISSVATAELSSTYGSVKRKDLDRIITVSSNVTGDANATEINRKIQALIESDYQIPAGYTYTFGGEQQKQREEMSFLSGALLLAVFLIFLIIVAQFNKITTPLIIMSSVILSTIGVFLGLILFNMDFVVIMTMIGIISLAGIVVNNAIVLIDFIELIRDRKRKETGVDRLGFDEIIAAIIEGGKTRLRPVLLTAITTVLGLIPLAVGINVDFIGLFTHYDPDFFMGGDNVLFWGPMSWTIVFGLTFATFLTLVIVPIMYLFFARFNRWIGIS
ncbi:MAG: efflux RND transporter permease subunit, partial [Cyclobacteriaceae bacterium]|nr:efflux RND transporter permease subunit [Cyclobacteriaceae bacterium]